MGILENITKGKVLKEEELIEYKEGKLNQKILIDNDNITSIVFAMDEGVLLPTHSADGDGLVTCIEGSARIVLDDEEMTINKGEVIVFPKNTPHSVKAIEAYKMMVNIIK